MPFNEYLVSVGNAAIFNSGSKSVVMSDVEINSIKKMIHYKPYCGMYLMSVESLFFLAINQL